MNCTFLEIDWRSKALILVFGVGNGFFLSELLSEESRWI